MVRGKSKKVIYFNRQKAQEKTVYDYSSELEGEIKGLLAQKISGGYLNYVLDHTGIFLKHEIYPK